MTNVSQMPPRGLRPGGRMRQGAQGAMLLIRGKTRFERPDGSIGKSPGDGVTLWAAGDHAISVIHRAGPKLGMVFTPAPPQRREG